MVRSIKPNSTECLENCMLDVMKIIILLKYSLPRATLKGMC